MSKLNRKGCDWWKCFLGQATHPDVDKGTAVRKIKGDDPVRIIAANAKIVMEMASKGASCKVESKKYVE